jgi:hypothetical protein
LELHIELLILYNLNVPRFFQGVESIYAFKNAIKGFLGVESIYAFKNAIIGFSGC